ncbi:MAG: phosphatidate cytidylyltransferase [Mycobacteriaceae bacterium]|nr:phosphatidate cytidylyltransferase [Mycobacteriaceae bacterium]
MASDFEAQVRATNDRINARTGRPLLRAILVGLTLGGAVLVSLLVVKELYMLFAGALVGFTTYELATALRAAGRDVPRIPTIVASLAVVPLTFTLGTGGLWLGFLGAVVVVSLWRLAELVSPVGRPPAREVWLDLGGGVFILSYIALMGGFTVLLTAQEGGQFWTLAFLIVVVSVDTGAYASGVAFGRHPMAPTISPKKTWEGFAGSAAAALLAAILLALLMLGQPWWVGAILGLTMLATATVGDLAESLIKRDLGIKDISTWLPGHGGFLDRVDSSLLSGAAAYALFLIFA